MTKLIKLNRAIQYFDFNYFLPFCARVPLPLGRKLADLRGILMALLDYDWRSNALGQRYVRSRVIDFVRHFSGGKSARVKMFKRFIYESREEWQGCLYLHKKKMDIIARKSHIECRDRFKALARSKTGVVLVSCHFDSYCMGIALPGTKGLRSNAVSSSAAVEDPRVGPEVRRFFRNKYRAMGEASQGGVIHYETGMDFFYNALENGEIVIVMGDVPGAKSSVRIDFLGKKLKMPLGAWHMAKKTGSLMGAYVNLAMPDGGYRMVCLPPYEIDPDDPVKTMKPVYAFLESWIRKMPERWVVSDVWHGYGDGE